jgi:alginate O-acetyltransferase complex protein AlgI
VSFTSLSFLFFFLPVTLLLCRLGGCRLRNSLLLAASLLFYAWGGFLVLPVLLLIIIGNFVFGLLLGHSENKIWKKVVLVLGIGANLFTLGHFKYTGFLLLNLQSLWPALDAFLKVPKDEYIPLGLSFITFHAISYLVDVFNGKAREQKNPVRLGLYLSFFPKVLSGPIHRYGEAAGQFTARRQTLADFSAGVERFIMGLAKKLLLANALAQLADPIFQAATSDLSAGQAWLGALCYSLEIYFDFSGYTDMAIGLGLMFGFRLPENFNYPYLSQSVREFWRRWHITLSEWFRDYLYIPLGGNRKGDLRTYCNLCIVFLLCGLWHGANWTFIVWGAMHGSFLVVERWKLADILSRSPKILRHLYLLLFVLVSWVFFRSPTLTHACHFLGAMIGLGTDPQPNPWILIKMDTQAFSIICLSCVLAFPVVPWIKDILYKYSQRMTGREELFLNIFRSAKVANLSVLFFLALLELAAGTYNPFIYSQF